MRKLAFLLSAVFLALSVAASAQILYSATPQGGYFDFGDNPDSYQTLLASDGARHEDGTLEWLGLASPDYETDTVPSVYSTIGHDDTTGTTPDDEEAQGLPGGIVVSVSDHASGRYGAADLLYVDGWIDLNSDGDFSDPGEHVLSTSLDPSTWGANTYTIGGYSIPTSQYSRWRVNYDEGVQDFFGAYTYGEVEDYFLNDVPPTPEPSTLFLFPLAFAVLWRWRARDRDDQLVPSG